MSNAVFPTLLGLDIAVKRRLIFATAVQASPVAGKELRAAWTTTPRIGFDLTFNFLRNLNFSPQTVIDEAGTLCAFFDARLGKWDSFLYTDPYENTVTLQNFGTGTGSATTFQLCDTLGNPIYDLNGTPSIYKGGVLQTLTTNYTISATGLVTFVVAPGAAVAVTWSGGYYRRCRFTIDELTLERIVNLAWKGGSVGLLSVK